MINSPFQRTLSSLKTLLVMSV